MAVIRAIANGNWSASSTWTGGVFPSNGDTVLSNGFNVTIDTPVTIGGANNPSVNAGSFVTSQYYQITSVGSTSFTSIGASSNTVGTVFQATGTGSGTGTAIARATITNLVLAGSTAGGGFLMPSVQTLTTDIRAGTLSSALTLSATTGTLSLSNVFIVVGTASAIHGINVTSTAGLSLTGCTISGAVSSGSSAHYINNASTATITVTNCALNSDGNSGNSCAINNASTGTVIVSGSSLVGTNGAAGVVSNLSTGSVTISNCTLTATGTRNVIANTSTGSVTISGCTITTSSVAGSTPIISNTSSGTFTITSSTLYASNANSAFTGSNVAANVSISGILVGSANGYPAVYCIKWQVGTSPTGSYIVQSLNGSTTTFTWYGADYSGFGQPSIADVRSGVSYAAGALTGTAVIPSPSSVAYGVNVDATTGTAVLTPSAVQAAILPLL